MKYIFIINSYTVGNKINVIKENIIKYCNFNNLEYVIEINNDNYNTEEIINKYKKDKNIIISVGGDGMLNKVLNLIIDTDNILSFIPCGTGNDFYRSVKLQCNNGINDIDLIKINDKYFINVACFGIDADIANDKGVSSNNIILKKYKYIISLLKNFYKYKPKEFTININSEKINTNFTTIALCNGMYYGRGFNIGPYSQINNGLIDVYLVKELDKIKMLKLILKMKKGKHEESKYVEKYNVKNLIIKSKNKVNINIDGESLEGDMFKIKVLEKKIKFYYNQEMIDKILK